jgi:signal transduction histidine kinase
MVEIPPTLESSSHPAGELLSPDEVVAVVDDSPELVSLLSRYLKKEGFQVVQAGSARELHLLIERNKIALLLLDIGLPDKNGDEILRDIVPENPNMGIIMVTGTMDIETALNCLREGADDYLTKPLSFKLFSHTVKNTLKKRRLAINNRAYQRKLLDITRELDKSRDLLVDAERMSTIGRMSSNLLHAIRNPLTSIGGTSRLLTKKTDDTYLLKFLNIITEETVKIERTLDNLSSYADDSQTTLAAHPIYALIRKTAMFFYNQLDDADIELRISLPGQGPEIFLDENKIRQLIVHLIKNSIESMQRGGTLVISSVEDVNFLTIRITDSGCGISADDLPRLRDPFFTSKTTGIGMGLAVVDQIVADHGGNFHVKSTPLNGTEVSVSFPLLIPKEGDNNS